MKRLCAFMRQEFTFRRWGTNPFQMYAMAMVLLGSLQTAISGPTPGSVLDTELSPIVGLQFAGCAILGSGTTLYGLHMRAFERGLVVECVGYVSVVAVFLMYLWLLGTQTHLPYFTYTMGLSCGVVLSCTHRIVQVLRYFWAKRNGTPMDAWLTLNRIEPGGGKVNLDELG